MPQPGRSFSFSSRRSRVRAATPPPSASLHLLDTPLRTRTWIEREYPIIDADGAAKAMPRVSSESGCSNSRLTIDARCNALARPAIMTGTLANGYSSRRALSPMDSRSQSSACSCPLCAARAQVQRSTTSKRSNETVDVPALGEFTREDNDSTSQPE